MFDFNQGIHLYIDFGYLRLIFMFEIKHVCNFLCNRVMIKRKVMFDISDLRLIFKFYATGPMTKIQIMFAIAVI